MLRQSLPSPQAFSVTLTYGSGFLSLSSLPKHIPLSQAPPLGWVTPLCSPPFRPGRWQLPVGADFWVPDVP
jgi:hypothetical protein